MSVFLDDGDVRLYHGDVIQTLRSLPAGIAQTCVTSPPYWGLRDYGTGAWTGGDTACDHVDLVASEAKNRLSGGHGSDIRDRLTTTPPHAERATVGYRGVCGRCGARRVDSQLGLESTPDLYVERLVAVFREVWRVLRDDGTCWINLGDSYWNGGAEKRDGGHGFVDGGRRKLEAAKGALLQAPASDPILKPKDLVGIPWKVAFALQADGWYLRSDIVWNKPNPMPESVTDRPTKAHEYLFLLAKRPRYFYDADAIRESSIIGEGAVRNAGGRNKGYPDTWNPGDRTGIVNDGYRNRRSVWTIATEPFPEAHFATYPQALVRPCILAGSRPGDTILDPFIGSGTTALVARNHGRRCIGIDLSAGYLAIAAKRLQQLSLLAGVDSG